MRPTSYPTSGYSLGTRGRRSTRRLVAPPRRRTPVIRLAIVALVLLLGSRALGVLQPHRDLHPVAATAPTATLHPAVASRPATRARPAPTATPSPSRPAPATQLPQVKVPVLSASWLRTHPIAEVPAIKGRAEEHTSELQSPDTISYAVFCLKKKKTNNHAKKAHTYRRIKKKNSYHTT